MQQNKKILRTWRKKKGSLWYSQNIIKSVRHLKKTREYNDQNVMTDFKGKPLVLHLNDVKLAARTQIP